MTGDSEQDGGLPVGAALHNAKRRMREHTLAARDRLPVDARNAAAAVIVQRIAALPSYRAARVVLLTLPFRSEWDTLPLVRAALEANKSVVLPRVDEPARMLVLHAIGDLERDIASGYAGIPEPRPACPVVAPEAIGWVLVPGVAFDAAGRRLGYGGGYYDRLLPLLPSDAARVAGAYDLQIVERVPAAPHDLAIDTIATETRTIDVRAP